MKEKENQESPVIDDLLLQEIYSLREKLKIAVAAVKSYNPEFDDREFTHRLNSVDFDQLMEELNEDIEKQALINSVNREIEIQPTASESIFIDAIRQADDAGNGEFNLSDEKATEMLAKYRASIMNEALKEAANRAVEYVFFTFDDDFNAKDITNDGLRAAIMGVKA